MQRELESARTHSHILILASLHCIHAHLHPVLNFILRTPTPIFIVFYVLLATPCGDFSFKICSVRLYYTSPLSFTLWKDLLLYVYVCHPYNSWLQLHSIINWTLPCFARKVYRDWSLFFFFFFFLLRSLADSSSKLQIYIHNEFFVREYYQSLVDMNLLLLVSWRRSILYNATDKMPHVYVIRDALSIWIISACCILIWTRVISRLFVILNCPIEIVSLDHLLNIRVWSRILFQTNCSVTKLLTKL